MGIGGLGATFLGGNEGNTFFGTGYAVSTLGTRANNLSIGFGYSFNDEDVSPRPFFTLSGMAKMGERISLISENYFFRTGNDRINISSLGLRISWESITVDAGLVGSFGDYFVDVAAIPWLSIIIPLGKKP